MQINRSPIGDSWRLVYSGNTLRDLIRSEGITSTIHTLEIFPVIDGDSDAAKAQADARVLELGLEIPKPPERKKTV